MTTCDLFLRGSPGSPVPCSLSDALVYTWSRVISGKCKRNKLVVSWVTTISLPLSPFLTLSCKIFNHPTGIASTYRGGICSFIFLDANFPFTLPPFSLPDCQTIPGRCKIIPDFQTILARCKIMSANKKGELFLEWTFPFPLSLSLSISFSKNLRQVQSNTQTGLNVFEVKPLFPIWGN